MARRHVGQEGGERRDSDEETEENSNLPFLEVFLDSITLAFYGGSGMRKGFRGNKITALFSLTRAKLNRTEQE